MLIETNNINGYYSMIGVEYLISTAINLNKDTTDLDEALATLRIYADPSITENLVVLE